MCFLRKILLLTTLPAIILMGCSGGGSDENASDAGVFSRPFAGEYSNSWSFDHDLPLGYFNESCKEEAQPHVLTWEGEMEKAGWGDSRCHNGYDWLTPEGTPLLAVADGEVIFADAEPPFKCGARGMVSALIVSLRHDTVLGVLETVYIHLSRIDVAVGDRVKEGEQIGLSGSTGCSSGPHLHFSVYRRMADGTRRVVDPFGWEGESDDPWAVHPMGAESIWLWRPGAEPNGY